MTEILPSKLTLKSVRINRGLTVKEVAKIFNKNCQIVLSYEKNSENIPVELLMKLSNIYQYPMDYIFLQQRTV
ncbi:helix-turn-helix transcriptional regulator [Lactococcus lactis]|uniref:helix-turn-helix transcriptional regulator n=1 Tax=Lactococcus lactis TaxID=1358 RepID=UPI000BF294AB|nr:helix-turn-helix transcriptional regulator [Lactococcus lactis]PFG84204.1 Cro/Cl family transcriptional regulator [Lactococcus lactis]